MSNSVTDDHITIAMAKRKAETTVPLEIDDEQREALRLLPDSLSPDLRCLVPLLETLRETYGETDVPHRKGVPVSLSPFQ